jgi:hypothetical protein
VQEYFDPGSARPLQEAMGAVDASAFAGITGQLLISRVNSNFRKALRSNDLRNPIISP